jgi:antitoxin VapB
VALNIKNSATLKLIRELAMLTGESTTAAITEAVRERLLRLRELKGSGLASRLIEIGKDCAAHLPEPYRSANHAHLLYDERGLPH